MPTCTHTCELVRTHTNSGVATQRGDVTATEAVDVTESTRSRSLAGSVRGAARIAALGASGRGLQRSQRLNEAAQAFANTPLTESANVTESARPRSLAGSVRGMARVATLGASTRSSRAQGSILPSLLKYLGDNVGSTDQLEVAAEELFNKIDSAATGTVDADALSTGLRAVTTEAVRRDEVCRATHEHIPGWTQ